MQTLVVRLVRHLSPLTVLDFCCRGNTVEDPTFRAWRRVVQHPHAFKIVRYSIISRVSALTTFWPVSTAKCFITQAALAELT
jgi:hypothetical protein